MAMTTEVYEKEHDDEPPSAAGYRTYDIMSEGKVKVGTKEMGDWIAGKIEGGK